MLISRMSTRKISEVLKKLTPDKIKGEFIIVIAGKDKNRKEAENG